MAGSIVAALEPRRVGSLLLASLAIMGSPGPATISLTAAGSAYGVRRSLAYLAGIVAGTTAVLIAVASGITVALLAVPVLRIALIAASAVYILWLAYRIATAPPHSSAPTARPPTLAAGAFLGVANPKAWVAIAAVFASVRVATGAFEDAGLKLVALTGMIVAINSAWLAAGASLAPVLRDPRRARWVNLGLAVALVVATAFALV
jgi:threonine/homoserine/homoserine lactone efflux protein